MFRVFQDCSGTFIQFCSISSERKYFHKIFDNYFSLNLKFNYRLIQIHIRVLAKLPNVYLRSWSSSYLITGNRVASLEHLSVAEFSGENDHKNVLAIWLDLVLNVKI